MTIYVDCPNCDNEFEYQVKRVLIGGWGLEVDLIKQHCECKLSEIERDELEKIAADKYE